MNSMEAIMFEEELARGAERRFREFLSDAMRDEYDEWLKERREVEQALRVTYIGNDREALSAAAMVSRRIVGVTHRGLIFREARRKFAEVDFPPVVVRVR